MLWFSTTNKAAFEPTKKGTDEQNPNLLSNDAFLPFLLEENLLFTISSGGKSSPPDFSWRESRVCREASEGSRSELKTEGGRGEFGSDFLIFTEFQRHFLNVFLWLELDQR